MREVSFDALLPPEMAQKAEEVGVKKASLPVLSVLVLAGLAGAFIALGAVFSTTVVAGAGGLLPYGLTRLAGGIAFSLGLMLVVVGGAELFTGNTLLVMAWASRRLSTGALLRNWALVFAGNFAGAVGTAALVAASGQYRFGGGVVGKAMLATAEAKLALGFGQAVALGVLCNVLVCLAVWLSLSARTTTDRVVAIFPPIAAFVAAGFEHSVANMYFVPVAIFVRRFAPPAFWDEIGRAPSDLASLDWVTFLTRNLVPVTIGNVIGGAVLVGAVYWFVYRRPARGA